MGVNELNLTLCQWYSKVSTFPSFTDEEMIQTKKNQKHPHPMAQSKDLGVPEK